MGCQLKLNSFRVTPEPPALTRESLWEEPMLRVLGKEGKLVVGKSEKLVESLNRFQSIITLLFFLSLMEGVGEHKLDS